MKPLPCDCETLKCVDEAFKPLETELWNMIEELRTGHASQDTLHADEIAVNLRLARAWASLVEPVRKAIDG